MDRRSFVKMAGLLPMMGIFRFNNTVASASQVVSANKSLCSQGSIGRILEQNQSSRLVMVAGRPSMGKTAVLLNLLNDLGIDANNECLFFSVEMSKESLMKRLLALRSNIPLLSMRNGKIQDAEWSSFITASESISKSKIYIDDSAGISVQEIRRRCEKHQNKSPAVKYVFVDYFQILNSENKHENRRDEATYILNQLSQMAKELNVIVIVAGQLNRGVEGRADRRPLPEDMREIRDLRSIDELLLLYRDYYYDKSLAQNVLEVMKFEDNMKTVSKWAGQMSVTTQKIYNFRKTV